MQLLHLGDLELTLPLAMAAGAWLLAARAWRAAAAWTLLYTGALALVGGSKVAYLAWGVDVPVLDFKALSGHATGVTAVYPVLGYLLCRQAGRGPAFAAAGAGLVLGLAVTAGLVLYDEHAAAEAAAGWLLGAGVSVGTLYQAEPRGVALGLPAAASAVLVYVASAALMQSAHVGYWMIKLALALSGNTEPFSWDTCG
ncbi:hypothetical protein [Massilia yuzhufengensis]|uniref:PAP2 superfamily protein n=1 Tax=Massilia yuzhufengensis TaxID=1164594 RepID=A0A1I1EJF4_9BURK|nr:hypothetical protein [Massilia yuzhufengensis]SFB85578.1 hypothetical protein SAMN05216204_10299 [Massilia yuzhufengensis]